MHIPETKTVKETALTVIHETIHRKFNSGGTFDEEFECFKAEVLHRKGILTESDREDIIKHIKENYPHLVE